MVALDIRYWGIFIDIAPQNAGGMLFWLFLFIGIAAMFGSAAALIHPSLVLSADSVGITFGGMPRLASQKRQVLWDNIERIEIGTFAVQSARNRQRRNVVALTIECDSSIDLTGCGDGAHFVVGTVAEMNDRTNSQRDPRAPVRVDLNQARNVVLIDSSYFDLSLHLVKEQLDSLRRGRRVANFSGKDQLLQTERQETGQIRWWIRAAERGPEVTPSITGLAPRGSLPCCCFPVIPRGICCSR